MSLDAYKISQNDIYDAVELIETDGLFLYPSTGYDVIVNNKRYPPKEVLRIAYRIATGEEIGIIYGGESVNKIFRDLDFEISRKIRFWKLGCHWTSSSPSFFDVIQEYSVVITVEDFPYEVGDMVLVTEGYTVYAVGKVTSALSPINSRLDLQEALEHRNVPAWVSFAKVQWYDLTDNEIFQYKLQAGIRRVHKLEIINKVLDIWDSRDSKLSEIRFYVKDYHKSPDVHWRYPCMVLVPNAFNDYGYQTCFDLFYYKDYETRDTLDVLKILQKDKNITLLPAEFTELSSNYCSLGQTLVYYQRLKSEFPYEFMAIGRALNDCVLYPEIEKEFRDLEGFKVSLLRSSEAQKALNESLVTLQMGHSYSNKQFQFDFEYTVPGAIKPHKIDVQFNTEETLPNRFFCLIGKNGTGKTKMLVQLTKKLCDDKEEGLFRPERPFFSKIIAVSFSLFDKFELPKNTDISYELISFKDASGLINEEDLSSKLWRAYKAILKSRIRKNIWLHCLRIVLEIDYIQFEIEELESLASKQEFSEKLDGIFSSGQKITFHFFTRLLSCIERNSIIIFDEPETHLHPNVVGRLLKALDYALGKFSSFSVLATHSPVIVQEIPSRFIRIVERQIDIPVIFTPTIECFGENLTNINNSIFRVDEEKELYKDTLEQLQASQSLEEINELFNQRLSLNAKLYLQTIINLKK